MRGKYADRTNNFDLVRRRVTEGHVPRRTATRNRLTALPSFETLARKSARAPQDEGCGWLRRFNNFSSGVAVPRPYGDPPINPRRLGQCGAWGRRKWQRCNRQGRIVAHEGDIAPDACDNVAALCQSPRKSATKQFTGPRPALRARRLTATISSRLQTTAPSRIARARSKAVKS